MLSVIIQWPRKQIKVIKLKWLCDLHLHMFFYAAQYVQLLCFDTAIDYLRNRSRSIIVNLD